MDLETFRKIPFRSFNYAHLQGWGEPLLNPNISEMIEIAKAKCKVGLTTNGLLIEEYLSDVAKLDLLAISIGAANAELHKAVRKYDLDYVLDNVMLLAEREKRPKIVVNTLMLKSTIKNLPEFVRLAAKCGADEVIANNLDYIPSKQLLREKVFSRVEDAEVARSIRLAAKIAGELGIRFVARPIVMEEALMCAENPIRNCLITYRGDVVPCVYLHLPTNNDSIVRFFEGEEVKIPKMYFGNITNSKFEKIWKSRSYESFRAIFEARLRILREILVLSIPELPEVCKTCYKAYSV